MGFFNTIRQQYGYDTMIQMKSMATNNIKLARLANRRTFLIKCRRMNVIPRHLQDGSKRITNLLDTTENRLVSKVNNWCKKITTTTLNLEIQITLNNISKLESALVLAHNTIKNCLPFNIYSQFSDSLKLKYKKVFNRVKSVNKKKFENLINTSKCCVHGLGNIEKWLVDLTTTPIPNEILEFLSLGPGFCLPIGSDEINVRKMLMEIEGVLSSCPVSCRDSLRARTTNILTNFMLNRHTDTWLSNHLNNLFKKTKSFLRQNDNLLILTADKGAVTVVMDKDTYMNKGNEMLEDTQTYQPINKNPLQTLETRTGKLLLNLKNKNFINNNLCQSLTTRNPNLSKCYFLPKIHKENVPLRPIISACGSATYRLSGYLASILSESLQHRTLYNVKDTFDFVDRVRDIRVPNNYVMVSLDVVNLFTNIPLELVRSIITEHWDLVKENCSFTLSGFLDTLNFIFDNSYFTFQDKIYLQKFGTPMGSPISPILAVMVMDHVLDHVIPHLPFDLPFIFKFVDDVITCVPRDALDTDRRLRRRGALGVGYPFR